MSAKMPNHFFDTSAISKHYHAETGTAKVDASRLLSEWSGPEGFLRKIGTRGPGVHYVLASPLQREN